MRGDERTVVVSDARRISAAILVRAGFTAGQVATNAAEIMRISVGWRDSATLATPDGRVLHPSDPLPGDAAEFQLVVTGGTV